MNFDNFKRVGSYSNGKLVAEEKSKDLNGSIVVIGGQEYSLQRKAC